MKHTYALFILMTLSIPLCAMHQDWDEDESTPFLNKKTVNYSPAPKKPYFGIQKEYPATSSIAPQFGFTDKKILNFLHAIEDNKDISSYLKDEKIVGNWRILAVGKTIAEKTDNEIIRAKIAAILKTKYNLQ